MADATLWPVEEMPARLRRLADLAFAEGQALVPDFLRTVADWIEQEPGRIDAAGDSARQTGRIYRREHRCG